MTDRDYVQSTSSDPAMVVVPMRFAGADLLIQATPAVVVGSEPTSATGKLVDAYHQAEASILAIASSMAGTIAKMSDHGRRPKEIEVEFGLSVSVEGDIVIVKGALGATLAIRLTYDATE